jgi:nucleoside-diphosphate-sugar epimerase
VSRSALLVTGASGFIGRTLLDTIRREALDRSYRVVLLSSQVVPGWETVADGRGNDGLYRFSAEDFFGRDIDAIDSVIHLGAFTPKDAKEAEDVAGSIANIHNARHLVVNLPSAPRRIVYASSIDVYGAAQGSITEEFSCRPRSLYGISKLFCEGMLASLLTEPRYSGTSLQVVRVGHTYGTGEEKYRKFIPETIRRLLRGDAPHFFTDGSEKRSFIHVEDCSRLILAALDGPADVGPINIASETALPLKVIADELCRIHAENGGSATAPTFEPKPAKGSDIVFDVAKMERYLGRPKVGIKEGLRSEYLAAKSKQ